MREDLGRDLKIDYKDDGPDDLEEELLALEAEPVEDINDLPGKNLSVGDLKRGASGHSESLTARRQGPDATASGEAGPNPLEGRPFRCSVIVY